MEEKGSYSPEEVAKVAFQYFKARTALTRINRGNKTPLDNFALRGYKKYVPSNVRKKIAKLERLLRKDAGKFVKATNN